MNKQVTSIYSHPNLKGKCPICDSSKATVFIEISQVPVYCNVLWLSQEEALAAPKGDINLAFCEICSLIFNLDFKPELMQYSQGYENSLHFSPLFQNYASWLTKYLIERHELHGKDIIEIGSGTGEFLTLLCELGGNRGIGFDPSYQPKTNVVSGQVKFIQDFYSTHYADIKADFIYSRHTLEHIYDPVRFLGDIHEALRNKRYTPLFFEVPNVSFILRDLSIWDIIYEHYSYFSHFSLAYLFRRCGFEIIELDETYEGQFLYIEALLGGSTSDIDIPFWSDRERLAREVTAFSGKYQNKLSTWHSKLDETNLKGQRVVVWGAGSKGVTFLNILDSHDSVEVVVDINPRKKGKYIPGTGHQVVSPDYLLNHQPDVIIVMNPIYQNEIKKITMDLGIEAEFILA